MKRILSISGGGMRGIGPVRILQEIEERTGRRIADIFDLLAGTSTGGIVACLAAAGVSMVEAAKFYYEKGPKIFRSGITGKMRSGGGLWGPRYESSALAEALSECLGATLMRDARTRVMVTTMTDRGAAEMVKSWEPEWADCPLSIAALMTSSAQTYFSPAKIVHEGATQYYLDGGNVRNAPMACAAFEAARLWLVTGEPMLVLHVGTGRPRAAAPLPHGGALAWAPRLFDATTQGDDSYDDYFCRGLEEFFPAFTYHRLDFTLRQMPPMDATDRSTLDEISDTAWHACLGDWNRFQTIITALQ